MGPSASLSAPSHGRLGGVLNNCIRSRCAAAFLACLLFASPALAQALLANGKLQLHFIDVGQGDAALLISPKGETVLFDDGVRNECDKPLSYLEQLGLASIDHHVASHYHDDHIGCAREVFAQFPLKKTAWDRGSSYASKTFTRYTVAVGGLRQAAKKGTNFVLDQGSPNPVTIKFVALNGNAVANVKDENDQSVVALVTFGTFKAELGGDLSGANDSKYKDIETSVAPGVGALDVYKVHHHGSEYSTNTAWVKATKPTVGVISTGLGNEYKHPTPKSVDALHAAGTKLYWTEVGNGAPPAEGKDTVGKNIIIEVAPGAAVFTVTYSGDQVDTFKLKAAPPAPPNVPPPNAPPVVAANGFAWSKRAAVYHLADCVYVDNISPQNLVKGVSPPEGKTLHADCPR